MPALLGAAECCVIIDDDLTTPVLNMVCMINFQHSEIVLCLRGMRITNSEFHCYLLSNYFLTNSRAPE